MTQVGLSLARSGGICRLCGVTDRQKRIAREEKAGQGQWLMQCGHCQGLYLDPDLSPAGLRRFYARDYRRLYPFESCARPDEAFLHAIRCREIGLRQARALAGSVGQNGRVLEIGSGHGGFLGRLHALRPDVALSAVEPDAQHRYLALDGAPVHFLDWADLADCAPFDLIVLFHTLEHALDPVGDLGFLATLLTTSGRLVIEVPETHVDALSAADIHPAHLTCFTRSSLHRTCLAAGLAPLVALAGQAALPACLWVEAGRQGFGAPPIPSESIPPDGPAVAPSPRSWARRGMEWASLTVLPPSWRGKLSRWRHGPVLDAGLAEPGGRVFCWGIAFDPHWTMEALLLRAATAMTERKPFRVADINVAKLIRLRTDQSFRLAVLGADAAVIDGMGVLWGLRALGLAARQRIAGVDLLDQVAALCAQRGWRPYIVGAKADVLARAVEHLQRRHPGLRLAGWREGYFPSSQDAQVAADLAASGADCLIVAFPYPRQDLFLVQAHAASAIPFAFGVGGAVDVLAGDRRRAPAWIQAAGLEWLFRLSQEPMRLGPRYASSNSRFLGALVSQWVARRLARR